MQDVILLRQMMQDSNGSDEYKRITNQKLDAMLGLCELASCRRQAILNYFDEDLTKMLKVKAVKVYVRGTTSASFDGEVVGDNSMEQYRACFRHIETTLTAGRTNFSRVVNMVVFLTNMDNWEKFNEVFREFVPNPPCRAVIGTTGLARPSIVIEIVDCFAYRVSE